MKRFLGIASAAVLMGASTLSFANAAVALGEKQILNQAARAVEAARLVTSGVTTEALVGQNIGGVLVQDAAQAAALVGSAGALIQAIPKLSTPPTQAQWAAMADAVSSEKTGLLPGAAIAALAEAITEHGSVDLNVVLAELTETGRENTANLLPSAVSKMDADQVAMGYVATSQEHQAVLDTTPATTNEEITRNKALQMALSSAEFCDSDASSCSLMNRQIYELWVKAGYAKKGDAALAFLSDLLRGFRGLPDSARASVAQFRQGGINALSTLVEFVNNIKAAPAPVAALDSCFSTGTAQ